MLLYTCFSIYVHMYSAKVVTGRVPFPFLNGLCVQDSAHKIAYVRVCVCPCFIPVLGPSLDQQVAVRSKMAELQANCQLLFSQVSNMRSAAFSPSPDTEVSLFNSAPSVNFMDAYPVWDTERDLYSSY